VIDKKATTLVDVPEVVSAAKEVVLSKEEAIGILNCIIDDICEHCLSV
jgi:hypothetical protein